MVKKKKEKTRVESVSEKINKILAEDRCNLWAVPKFVPFQKEEGKIVWEIHTEIKVLEIKDEQKDKPK